jgi:ankyrin repeat protein
LKAGADVNYTGSAGFTCLHAAATDGFLEVVKVLVAAKADVNRKNAQGRTPAECALEVYRTDIVDVLLKNKANLAAVRRRLATPEDGNFLLHNACVLGHADAVKGYLTYGADPNLFDAFSRTPLMQAVNGFCTADASKGPVFLRIASTLLENRAETGNRQSLDLLLKRGADTGARDKWGRSVLQLASASGDITIVSSLLGAGVDIDTPGDRGMEDTALNMAVRKRQFPMVDFLILHGADTDAGQRLNPIQNAVVANDLEMVRFLLERGVDPDGRTDGGMTALLYLPGRAGLDMARLLVQAGGDVNAVMVSGDSVLLDAGAEPDLLDSMGIGALASACETDSLALVRLLVERGADLEQRDYAGQTPLAYAVGQGRREIASFLIDSGANVNATDNSGQAVILRAKARDDQAMVDLLIAEGAVDVPYTPPVKPARKGR